MEQNEDKPKKMGRQCDICAQKRAALRRPKTHQQYGVPLKVVPYKSLYGWTMDEIVKEMGLKNNCTFCGVFRCQVQRRKCLEDNPESSSKDEPVVFHTYMIPWWVWAKRFYLPEVELLSGCVALIGFFMADLVESLTGVGLVDQMDSGFDKLFFLSTVAGVLLIRKNEDLPNLKQFVKEWTLYDKQWKATWQDETPENPQRD